MVYPSSIDRLPDEVRGALQTWLRDPEITQLEATGRLNALLEEFGSVQRVSRHAVNRYDRRLRAVGERLRQSRQVAEAWIAKLGALPAGKLGHLITEMLRTLAFDLALRLQEGELSPESLPKVIEQLKHLSLSVVRLERAAGENARREHQETLRRRLEGALAHEQTHPEQFRRQIREIFGLLDDPGGSASASLPTEVGTG